MSTKTVQDFIAAQKEVERQRVIQQEREETERERHEQEQNKSLCEGFLKDNLDPELVKALGAKIVGSSIAFTYKDSGYVIFWNTDRYSTEDPQSSNHPTGFYVRRYDWDYNKSRLTHDKNYSQAQLLHYLDDQCSREEGIEKAKNWFKQ